MWSKSRKGGNATYAPQLSDDETENTTTTISTKNVTKSTNVSNKSSKNKNNLNNISNPYHQPLQHTSSMPTTTSKNNQKSSNKSSMPKSSSSLQVSQQQQSLSSLSSNDASLLSFKPIIENSNNPPDLVGKYVSFSKNLDNLLVDRKIAEGGFSTVYSVKKQKQNFALKRMFVNSIQDLKACKIEIELMHSLLNKPNIIQYFAHSIHLYNSEVYEVRLLMENATGGTLLDMMNSRLRSGMKGFESDVISKVLKDIVKAIAALHFHKNGVIVHRDLKIENILMNGRGDFVICDLGSATKRIVNTEAMAASEIMVYEEELNKVTTQLYKSPEMVDLYSGGVIGSGVDIWVSKHVIFLGTFIEKLG